MRNAFADEITHQAVTDDRIVLLSGDIGNKLFNGFKDRCPDRFYNCGVAEANMTSVAAGMALMGMRPVTYTIASFNTFRCFEQIRVDVCYQNLPVIIVGVGAGLSYSELGGTHHSCEDIGILRTLPNLTILCPGDPVELRLALREALLLPGPCYLRLGKKGETTVHEKTPHFQIGKAITVREGTKTCLIVTGNLLPTAIQARDQLESQGVSCQVISMPTVKPLDKDALARAFQQFKFIGLIEEHSLIGGLSSSIAEWMVDSHQIQTRVCRFGTQDRFLSRGGSQENTRTLSGLTGESISSRMLELIKKSSL